MAQLLVPLDSTQHPLLDGRLGYPQTVGNFGWRCDRRHRDSLWGMGFVGDWCSARCTARGRAAASNSESCPQLLSTGAASMPMRYQPRGKVGAWACINARTWRRTRLRTTADPIRFGVANATCTPAAEESGTMRTVKIPSRVGRMPWKRANPRRRGIRLITPKDVHGP